MQRGTEGDGVSRVVNHSLRYLLLLLVLCPDVYAQTARAVAYEVELSVDFAEGTIEGVETVVLRGGGSVGARGGRADGARA